MIFDKLTNLTLYKGLFPNLDIAIDYIAGNDLSALALGRHDISGDDVYVSVMEIDGKDPVTTPFEIHKRYLDIHIDLTGTELIETGNMGHVTEEPFDDHKDFGLVSCPLSVQSHMTPEDFYICMLNEPHKPACADGKSSLIRKCVFKVFV